MATLTPRYESKLGSDCTGVSGAANRTYTLANSEYYSVIEVLLEGVALHETIDFTISSGIITFLGTVDDTDTISLRYFTSDGSTIVAAGYGYVTTSDVYRTSGLTTTEISSNDVAVHILRAENVICRATKNIYWNIALDAQAATAGAAGTITKTGAGWTVNSLADMYVWIYSGTGATQLRKILSNTADTITVDRNWTTTNPDNTSLFKVFYVPANFNPYISESYDGSGLNHTYLPYYPVKKVETLSIGLTPTIVTPSNLYVWEKTGKIMLKNDAEATVFSRTYPQEVAITYWYGVDHLPYDVKRLVELQATFQIYGQQLGGTFDDASTIGLPEVNVTIGQAYINIRGALDAMQQEYRALLTNVKVWPVFA
jgi:hypothetical protein